MCTIHCSLYGSLYVYNSLYTVWISVCVQFTVHCMDLCMCTIHCRLYGYLYVNSLYTERISVFVQFILHCTDICMLFTVWQSGQKTSKSRQCTAHFHRSESWLYRSLCFITHFTFSSQCTVYYEFCVVVCPLYSSLVTVRWTAEFTLYRRLHTAKKTVHCIVLYAVYIVHCIVCCSV